MAYEPSKKDREFHAAVQDRDHEQTPERAAEMRARGWQDVDEHRWWRTTLPKTAPMAAATLARLIVTDLRARDAVSPHAVTAWDISAGDDGKTTASCGCPASESTCTLAAESTSSRSGHKVEALA